MIFCHWTRNSMDNTMNTCALCEKTFERKNKGFKRCRISVLLDGPTFAHLFPMHDYATVNNQFLCQDCHNFINRRTVKARKRGIKRKLPTIRKIQPRAKGLKQECNTYDHVSVLLDKSQDLLAKSKMALDLPADTSEVVQVARCTDQQEVTSLIARFMGPTWGPSGADRTQVGPMLAIWTLLSGVAIIKSRHTNVMSCKQSPASWLFAQFCHWKRKHQSSELLAPFRRIHWWIPPQRASNAEIFLMSWHHRGNPPRPKQSVRAIQWQKCCAMLVEFHAESSHRRMYSFVIVG